MKIYTNGNRSIVLRTDEDRFTVTSNVWDELALVLQRGINDTGGKVDFYIDGVIKGSINSPVATSEPLVPGIWVMASDTGAPIVDVDWIAVSGPRDTGR